jgi:leucyl-tRNA synthetase
MSRQKTWHQYQPQKIESHWQKKWAQSGLFLAHEQDERPKYYCLDFFPYPSGYALHVGHCRNYVPTDLVSRYKRMKGFNVLHPMGWDAFGEPSEQYAITHGVHPQATTLENTRHFRRQLEMIGTGYDWSREIWSSSPEYYRWTQWFFLLLYKRGLAYRDTNWQWWCPTCQTTLSSHEVAGGVCWRGHTGVSKREIPAWYFRIIDYADRLLDGLDRIDWPDSIIAMQRNWIGRSEGVQVTFPIKSHTDGAGIQTFTTRPDTLFGITFIVLAPEHPQVEEFTTATQRALVQAYQAQALSQSEVERMNESRPKTGVFTGGYVQHPLSGNDIPVWIADYVLPTYGTGAVMGVPAHDERDFAFATTHGLSVQVVVSPPGWTGGDLAQAYTGPGVLVNSAEFDGEESERGGARITGQLEQAGLGQAKVQYRMRDWLISRQRYWGTPIPIVHCATCGIVPVPDTQLPVLLPPMDDFQPDGSGRSPLARLPEFVNTPCPNCGGPAQRETDTMGGFACSSWYYLRFANPSFDEGPFDPQAVRCWLPVDLYVGGAEHAVLHLLYARFWTKVMFDAGLLDFDEPFGKLLNQGQLMGTDGQRMSKSRGNVVTPESICETYGADALRVYLLFMAPFDQDSNWSTDGINGIRRFLNRIWSLVAETYMQSAGSVDPDPELERLLHRTVRQVTERLENMRFNTMISGLMEFTNTLLERHRQSRWRTKIFHQSLDSLLLLLAPSAPHITEELWHRTGHSGSIHSENWPTWNADLAQDELAQIAVQVNGKLRTVLSVPVNMSQDEVLSMALSHPRLQPYIQNQASARVVYIPRKILNFVIQNSVMEGP